MRFWIWRTWPRSVSILCMTEAAILISGYREHHNYALLNNLYICAAPGNAVLAKGVRLGKFSAVYRNHMLDTLFTRARQEVLCCIKRNQSTISTPYSVRIHLILSFHLGLVIQLVDQTVYAHGFHVIPIPRASHITMFRLSQASYMFCLSRCC
jgi:hypothetical protein